MKAQNRILAVLIVISLFLASSLTALPIIKTVHATTPLSNLGFEDGNGWENWYGYPGFGSFSIDHTNYRYGNNCSYFAFTGGSGGEHQIVQDTNQNPADVTVDFRLESWTFSSTSEHLLIYSLQDDSIYNIKYNTVIGLAIGKNSSGVVALYATWLDGGMNSFMDWNLGSPILGHSQYIQDVQLGRWYNINLQCFVDSANGWVQVFIDSVLVMELQSLNTAANSATYVKHFSFGEDPSGTGTMVLHEYSDAYIAPPPPPESLTVQPSDNQSWYLNSTIVFSSYGTSIIQPATYVWYQKTGGTTTVLNPYDDFDCPWIANSTGQFQIWSNVTDGNSLEIKSNVVNVTISPALYWLNFTVKTMDTGDPIPTGIVHWEMYNGSQLLNYVFGDTTLLGGYIYTTNWFYKGIQVWQMNDPVANIGWDDGNATLDVYPQMVAWSGGYVGISLATYEKVITINNDDSDKLNFTVTSDPVESFQTIIGNIPKMPTSVLFNGTDTNFGYSPSAEAVTVNSVGNDAAIYTIVFAKSGGGGFGGGGGGGGGGNNGNLTPSNGGGGGLGASIGQFAEALLQLFKQIPPWAIWALIAIMILIALVGMFNKKNKVGRTPTRELTV